MARIIKHDGSDSAVKAMTLNLAQIAEQARSIVLEARKEAARIAAEARAAAEKARRQAAKEGYESGLADGREQGRTEGRQLREEQAHHVRSAETAQAAATVAGIARQLAGSRDELLQACRGQMLQFAIELAEKIVGRVAVAGVSAAEANLAKALELVGGGEICVKVHPEQYGHLKHYCSEIIEQMQLRASVKVQPDKDVSKGGVRIVSPNGEIDATIRAQMDAVVATLLGAGGGEGIYVPAVEPSSAGICAGDTETNNFDGTV